MGAVEGVVGRLLVGLPQLLDHVLARAGRAAARVELRLELGHRLAVLLADRLAQVVRARAGEAGERLGDLHRLLLVQDHALAGLGDRAQAVVDVADRLGVALAARVGGDLVHGARAVERHERDEVLELGRLDLLERLAHALGLELEHAHRVAAGHHLVGLVVVERQRRHVDPAVARALDDGQRVLDDVEVAQAQEVHLEQADLLDRLHRVLGDRAVDLRAVLPHAGVGELERDDVGQRAVGDHDGGGVDRGVADDPLEAAGDVDDLLGGRVPRDLGGELGPRLHAVLERRRAALLGIRDQLGEAVADAVVVAEDAGGVARGGAREHAAEGDDLRHAVGRRTCRSRSG